jgi:hypothetical protein
MLLKLLLTLLFLLCVQLAGAAKTKMSAPMNLLFSEFWTWRLSR